MKKLNLDSEIFTRAVEDIITREELTALLRGRKKLRIKHGIDATAPSLHIGHAASLWKLRVLQEAGHRAVILLGDTTTEIGDPTGRFKTRPVLTKRIIDENLNSIEKQAKSILLTGAGLIEVHRSSEWYDRMNASDFLQLLSRVTHSRLIERDMFRERIKNRNEIFIHEFVYPILQGYDSVELKADLTVIGSDQLFNEHMGRFFQEQFRQKPQVIVALKILPGLGGGEKMSKSKGNYIGLDDSPTDKFGKAMRLIDSLITDYLKAYTDVPLEEIGQWEKRLRRGTNPMEAKLFFAESLVRRYHGTAAAANERTRFLKIFSERRAPQDLPPTPVATGEWDPAELLVHLRQASSKSDARRLIDQGAVSLGDDPIVDWRKKITIGREAVLKVGKHRFVKIKPGKVNKK